MEDKPKTSREALINIRQIIDGGSSIGGLEKRHIRDLVDQGLSSGGQGATSQVEKALDNLIKTNEEHNKGVEAVIGRPLKWDDSYLNEAREALAAIKGKVMVDGRGCLLVDRERVQMIRDRAEWMSQELKRTDESWARNKAVSELHSIGAVLGDFLGEFGAIDRLQRKGE